MDNEINTNHVDLALANTIIATDVINERLAIEPSPQNIQFLADCITTLENNCANRGEICA